MSECKNVSVALWLSTGFSRERPGFDIKSNSEFCLCHYTCKWLKSEVPPQNSFEYQLCGMLKNPHAIRKKKARSSRCCGLFFTQVKNVKVFFFFFQEGQW